MIDGLKTTTTLTSGVMVSATINASGNLIITLSNGQTINAGAVRGASGSIGPVGNKGDKGDTGTQGSGFVVDYKGPGITPRAAYNSSPAGTSYLDTTYGMLYFRQTDTIGQWGPAIPISGTGGNLSSVDFVSHGSITDPADSSQTIPAHNVLRIKSVSDASPTDSGKTWSLTGVSAPAKLKQIYARGDTTWEAVRPKMSRISDVTAPPTATQFNQLLAELRNKGYME